MDFDLTGISVLASELAFYLLVALVLGLLVGWMSAAPSDGEGKSSRG